MFLQCPICRHRWWHDTELGVGDRPLELDQLPDFPASPGKAA
ncbi:MAG TPA: hypothetical protein VHH34_17185 [Pseudonocardiaceae bacterium]|nr:hypothetical protein [Pseudonocardiaceae bacterium]